MPDRPIAPPYRASQMPLLPRQPLRPHRPKRLARLPQHRQGILGRADQARLDRADQREVEQSLGLRANRLRVRGRHLELGDQRAAVVEEREEPLEEGDGARGRLVVGYGGIPGVYRTLGSCGWYGD